MTKEEFDTLLCGKTVQPNYPEYNNQGFRVLTINRREGLVEVSEVRYFGKTTWYRYENLSVVEYSKVLNSQTFEVVEKYK